MAVCKDNRLKKKDCWYFQVTISTNPLHRHTQRGFSSRKEAQRAETLWLEEYKNKPYVKEEPKKFEDIMETFLSHAEKNFARATVSNYRSYYKNHLGTFIGLKIKNITPIVMQQWQDSTAKTLSPYLYNNCRKLLKAAFNYCVKLEMIDKNPFNYLTHRKEPKKLRNRFSLGELKRILGICKEEMPYYYLLFTLATLTGLRCSEYVVLTTADINLELKNLSVNKQCYRGEMKQTKTLSSTRIVEFGDIVKEAILFHCKKYNIQSGFLFPSEENKNVPLGYRTLGRRFQKLLVLAGYPKNYMRLHDLRGQYIDILHSQGVPTKLISQEVGHSSTRITNDIYSYILQDTRDVAKYAVDKALA